MPTLPAPTTAPAAETSSDAPSPGRTRRRLLETRPAAELALAAQSGDAAATEELYRRIRARADRAARAYCREGDADDAVAEGLTAAFRRIGQLRDPAAVEAWMLRCVVRSAIDLARRRHRQPPTGEADTLVDGVLRAGDSGESAAEQAISVLERAFMAEVLRGLEPGVRRLLYLRYDACLSVQQIASALGRPPGTVRRQCVEARRIAGQRFLGRHLRPAAGACAEVTAVLCQTPYRRPASRIRKRTSEHLRRCPACRDRRTELAAVLTELGWRVNPGEDQGIGAALQPLPARRRSRPTGS